MAKKAKVRVPEIVIDEQGYETDGMYRWGGPRIPLSEEILKKWVNEFNAEFHLTAAERIAKIRKMLTKAISPYVDGPLSVEVAKKLYARSLRFLNLSTGKGCYALHAGVPSKSWLEDVCDAVSVLDKLEELIEKDRGNIDQIVRLSVHVGMKIVRADLRATFGPDVISAKRRRIASAKGGKATAKWTPEIAELARTVFAKEKRGKTSKDAAYRRTAAKLHSEYGIIISRSTLKRHLDPPSA